MWPSLRHRLVWWIAIPFVLATAIYGVLASLPRQAIGPERAVQIASRRLLEIDPTFRPADLVARAFLECSLAPLTVDYSRRGVGPVVARVRVDRSGSVRSAGFFSRVQYVESYRSGRLFRLEPDGSVAVEIAPYPYQQARALDRPDD